MNGEDFSAFYQRTVHGMLARAIMLCGHRQDAQDAVDEAYLEVSRVWEARVAHFECPEGWVHRVMIQRLRRISIFNGAQERLGRRLVPPQVASLEQTAFVRQVLELIAELPERQRAGLVLTCQGVMQEEIAELLGIPRGTVASDVHRARRSLKRSLGLEDPIGAYRELSGGFGFGSGAAAGAGAGQDQVTALVLSAEFALERGIAAVASQHGPAQWARGWDGGA
jgi:RNA polymerase sigma-70 factor (ECF subfamily)